MKLPVSVLATLCAVGCEAAYTQEPQYPEQPAETYEVAEPNVQQVEQSEPAPLEVELPGVAPIRQRVVQPTTVQQPRQPHIDDCPGCGLG